jgi:hypothetical protein
MRSPALLEHSGWQGWQVLFALTNADAAGQVHTPLAITSKGWQRARQSGPVRARATEHALHCAGEGPEVVNKSGSREQQRREIKH